MKQVDRIVDFAARFLSIAFKIGSVGWFIFAFWLTDMVIDTCTVRRVSACSAYVDIYGLYMGGAFLIPLLLSIFSLAVSFMLDLWVGIRRSNRLVRELHKYIEGRLKW